jgi:phosphatidylglycerol:prolipoprotein diacylglycerol transferase
MAFPNGTVPTLVPVHPTPIYEALIMGGVCLILLKLGRRNLPTGRVFCFYLVLAGTERFMIEFWRINPVVVLGLTMAQFMSIAVITFGVGGLLLGQLKTERV